MPAFATLRKAIILSIALPMILVIVLARNAWTYVRTHRRVRALWARICRRHTHTHTRTRIHSRPRTFSRVLTLKSHLHPDPVLAVATTQQALAREHVDPCVFESASSLAARLRAGVCESVRVVEAVISQAQRVNGCLNAIAERRYHAALEEAREADARLRAYREALAALPVPTNGRTVGGVAGAGGGVPSIPPFLGVPCTIKEVFALEGMLQTAGVMSRRETRAKTTATCVRRLREAGFIVITTTNVSELCMWYESHNNVYGRTRNAYDHGRMVGGSSGGEAALISACGAPVGLGSDIGGSIRMPAAFNGIFGHKPSGGLIPNTGQYPSTPHAILTSGPLCRHSEDLWPLVKLLIGPDHVDPACRPMPCVDVEIVDAFSLDGGTGAEHSAASSSGAPGTPTRSNLPASPTRRQRTGSNADSPWSLRSPTRIISSWRSVTIFTIHELDAVAPRFSNAVEPAIKEAVALAASTMVSTHGCKGVLPFYLPELRDAFDIWTAVLGTNGPPTFADLMAESYGGKLAVEVELLKWCFGAASSTLPALILTLIEAIPNAVAPGRQAALAKLALELRRRVSEQLAAHQAVLILPVHPTSAAHHDIPLLRPFNVGYTQMFNVLELPATVAPIGLDADGMPVAVQIVGAHGYDRLTIAVAEALEQAGVAGWIPPPVAACPACKSIW